MQSFYIYETQFATARTCSYCGLGMNEGYLEEILGGTYCSDTCLKKIYTPEEIESQMLNNLFWTDWYDELEVTE